jgi:copper chaperone CopZ
MTCGGCEQAIQQALGRLPGVRQVRASHTARRAEVTYEPGRVSPDQIVNAINKLGYRAAWPAR